MVFMVHAIEFNIGEIHNVNIINRKYRKKNVNLKKLESHLVFFLFI